MKLQTCKSIDHRCDVQSTYVTVPTSSNAIQTFTSFLPSAMVSMYLQTTAFLEEELLQVYVRVRAITCPIFRCFVCLCEIVSTNRQSSCIPKHSYMHNHASYMFMHLIRLSCYSYASAFSIPMLISIKINQVNFKFPLLTINVYCHVNFKMQRSCQTSLSNSSTCSYVNRIQIHFEYNLSLLTAKRLVRIQEQLVPVNLFLLSVKRPVRIQEQLVPILLISAERPVQTQEQLVLSILFLPAK